MSPTITVGAVLDGVDPVVEAVAARLEASIVDELARLEVAHGRPVPVLEPPDDPATDLWRPPRLVARSDRAILEPDDYPALLVVPQNTDQSMHIDMVDGAAVLRIPYRVRVWAMCRYYDNDGEGVVACRNRLALGVMQALLRSVRLTDRVAVDLTGWRQSFSDVGVDDQDESTVAGWWVELTCWQDETVSLDSVAEAGTITLAVHPEAD